MSVEANDEYQNALRVLLISNSVADAIHEVRDLLKLGHVTYHLAHNIWDPLHNPFVRTTYPAEWVSHYLLNNFASIDPVVVVGMSSTEPFFWADLETSAKSEKLFLVASSFGILLDGYSVPHSDSKGRGSLFSVTVDANEADPKARLSALSEVLKLLAKDIHIKAIAEAYSDEADMPQLPPRELECLKWTAAGKTYSEIAIILHLSEHTVRSYLKSVRLRLSCSGHNQSFKVKNNLISEFQALSQQPEWGEPLFRWDRNPGYRGR